ncbi:hypothetical protein ILYODFUR_037566 [Ilyodon furcidens]|uniref:Uncharacterized protein n=1 Tax=Ilyodon furcidens TaxID=33524 RepID=A0ABV0VKD0_9TELE
MPYSCSCTTSYGQLETAEHQSRPEGFTGPSDIYSKVYGCKHLSFCYISSLQPITYSPLQSCSHVLMCYVEHGFKISLVIIFRIVFHSCKFHSYSHIFIVITYKKSSLHNKTNLSRLKKLEK